MIETNVSFRLLCNFMPFSQAGQQRTEQVDTDRHCGKPSSILKCSDNYIALFLCPCYCSDRWIVRHLLYFHTAYFNSQCRNEVFWFHIAASCLIFNLKNSDWRIKSLILFVPDSNTPHISDCWGFNAGKVHMAIASSPSFYEHTVCRLQPLIPWQDEIPAENRNKPGTTYHTASRDISPWSWMSV